MVMERDDHKGSGKPSHGHKVGVGGREYPTQIGKTCEQQKPGESEKAKSGNMSWSGHVHHKGHK